MKIFVYDDPHKMPYGTYQALSTAELSVANIATLPTSEYADFLKALSSVNTPTIAHIRIKSGKEVIRCQHKVQLVVTSIPGSDGSFTMVFGVGYNSDREGGDYLESFELDPILERVSEDYREELMANVKDFDGWRSYFNERLRRIRDSNRRDAKHLLYVANLCEQW